LSPLDGVVLTIKDNIPVAGLPCRWGSRLYQDLVTERDESPVARLRAAGAVILGKTNVPEFTLQGYTDNLLDGATCNPWNTALTPGGSSGGAVAAVACGIGPLALATDGGGSIRRPASHAGVVGFKPSRGAVPRAHGLPEILPGFEVIGPIARRVGDLVLAMSVIGGARLGDWTPHEQADALPPLRIACWRAIGSSPVDAEILERCDAAAQALRALGHEVREETAPARIEAFNQNTWPVISCAGLAGVLGELDGHEADMTPALQQMLARGRALLATELFVAQLRVRELSAEMAALFTRIDLVLTPAAAALPWPAHETHPPVIADVPVDGRGHAVFTAFANAAGLPGLALPAAPSAAGLPIGIQLVGPQGADARLLALGLQYETAQPWHTRWPLDD
jgi:aspartyl-tRNA(Asn)/glutamyl-tRNA(Gln) amidotransferase subunit A